MNLWYLVSLAVTILLFLGACYFIGMKALPFMNLGPMLDRAARIILGLIAIVIVIMFFTHSIPLIPLGGYHNT